jgi:hypothetical protein
VKEGEKIGMWVGVRAWVTLVVHFATHRIDGDVDGSRYDA